MSGYLKGLLIVLSATGFFVSQANASIEKIRLSQSEQLNAETGARIPVILNPSGEVDVTYTMSGARLTYVDVKGHSDWIEISADYPTPPTEADGSLNRYNAEMKQSIDSGGKRFPTELIKIWASHIAQAAKDAPEGSKIESLLMKFDRQGRVGFHPTYQLQDVLLVAPAARKSLAEAIRHTLDVQIRERLAQQDDASRSRVDVSGGVATASASAPIRMGFITPHDAVAAPMCARLFVTAR